MTHQALCLAKRSTNNSLHFFGYVFSNGGETFNGHALTEAAKSCNLLIQECVTQHMQAALSFCPELVMSSYGHLGLLNHTNKNDLAIQCITKEYCNNIENNSTPLTVSAVLVGAGLFALAIVYVAKGIRKYNESHRLGLDDRIPLHISGDQNNYSSMQFK